MRVHNLTVCDQVRVENNGKFLLIGVYTNTILLSQFPSHFGLNIWLLVEPDAVGSRPFAFRAKMAKSGAQIFEMDGGIEVITVDEWIPMAFGAEVLLIEPDDIVIEGRFGTDEEWIKLRTMHVRSMPMMDAPTQNTR